VYTLLARGPVVCSLAVNAASCLTAPLTMALTFAVYEELLGAIYFLMQVLLALALITWTLRRARAPAS
jgi:hypothetical protein